MSRFPNKDYDALIESVVSFMKTMPISAYETLGDAPKYEFDLWEWPQGVALYGLYKYSKASGKQAHRDFIVNWYEKWFQKAPVGRNVNTTAPMLALAFLAEETGDAQYMARCLDWLEWVENDLARTPERGIQHIVTGHENHGQIWDDTLFMAVLFITKMGMILKRDDLVQEAVHQFLLHIKYLYDRETGLWFHGWTFDGNHNFANARWARGNCWITACVVDFIEMTAVGGAVRQYLLDTLQAQVDALAKLQDVSGAWHTLLDKPDSYIEISATAGFAYGILKGVRKGYLDAKYEDIGVKALHAVLDNIAPSGEVKNVSWGTGMGHSLQAYYEIPVCPTPYGQSLALMLLEEVAARKDRK